MSSEKLIFSTWHITLYSKHVKLLLTEPFVVINNCNSFSAFNLLSMRCSDHLPNRSCICSITCQWRLNFLLEYKSQIQRTAQTEILSFHVLSYFKIKRIKIRNVMNKTILLVEGKLEILEIKKGLKARNFSVFTGRFFSFVICQNSNLIFFHKILKNKICFQLFTAVRLISSMIRHFFFEIRLKDQVGYLCRPQLSILGPGFGSTVALCQPDPSVSLLTLHSSSNAFSPLCSCIVPLFVKCSATLETVYFETRHTLLEMADQIANRCWQTTALTGTKGQKMNVYSSPEAENMTLYWKERTLY